MKYSVGNERGYPLYHVTGLRYVNLTENELEEPVTVITVYLKGEASLYREACNLPENS